MRLATRIADARIKRATAAEYPDVPSCASRFGAAAPRATNVTLPEELLSAARDLGINFSQACERGLAAEVATARRHRWLAENGAAMQAWNDHVAAHGLPLANYRQF